MRRARRAGFRGAGALTALAVVVLAAGSAVRMARDGRLPVLGAVAPWTLTAHDGPPASLEELRGRVWIADFIFTRCRESCPVMSEAMGAIRRELPPAIVCVSVSLDPAYDTPAVLSAYAAQWSAPGPWRWLTGPEEAVWALSRNSFRLAVAPHEDPSNPILHATRFALVDGEGRLRGVYDGLAPEGRRDLTRDARLLSSGRVWVLALPHFNVLLNAVSALLLVWGWSFVRRGRLRAHRAAMLSALMSSGLFLASYLTYHAHVGARRFPGAGAAKAAYLALLGSHTVLAAVVAPLALLTAGYALRGRFRRHRRLARWTLPIWVFVSLSGILVYVILYGGYAERAQ